MNWDDLSAKKIPAPFQPPIKDALDVSNFSEEFTNMVAADSPAVVPLEGEKLFKVSAGGKPYMIYLESVYHTEVAL